MASPKGKLCGPCKKRDKTTTAVSWCMDCEEGLCSSCLEDHKVNKASKNHQTIPVSQYVGIESVSSLIKQECEKHDQRLTFYCLNHYVTACALCVPERHQHCTDIKAIDELSRQSKTSTELLDIEKGLTDLLDTLDELRSDRQGNIEAIKNQKQKILMEIKSFRETVNNRLDELESNFLKQLETYSDQTIFEIDTFLSKLKRKKTKVKSLGETVIQMKKSVSNVQMFFATLSLSKKLYKEQKRVSTLCDKDIAKEADLQCSTNTQLKHMISDLKDYGTLEIVRKPCKIKVRNSEQKGAQLNVPTTTVRNIDHRKLEQIHTISFENGSIIRDCVIVNDGRMIFANTRRGKVLVYAMDGNFSKSISVGNSPVGLAVKSTNTVAVSCCEGQLIQIINIDDCTVEQEINVGKSCSGLSYYNDNFYVLAIGTGILELDLTGTLIRTIPVHVPENDCYLSFDKERFCYTCYNKFIACCDSHGTEIWRLNVADSGVTVDNCGNYFATKFDDNTLQIISADGKKTKQLLTKTDGIVNPEGVFFDKNSNQVLVACRGGTAILYRVNRIL